jgi:hypothetical protein
MTFPFPTFMPDGGRKLSTVTVPIGIGGGGAGPDNFEARLYTDNAGSPGTQIGTSSATANLNTTGLKTFTFASPPTLPASGTVCWVVVVPVSVTGDIFPDTVAASASFACGQHATITSIAATGQVPATVSEEWKIGINVTEPVADVGLGGAATVNQRTMTNGNSFGIQFTV